MKRMLMVFTCMMGMAFVSSSFAMPDIDINHHNGNDQGVVKSTNKNVNSNRNSNYNKASNYSSNKASARSSSKAGAYSGGNSVNVEGHDSSYVYKEVRQAPVVVPGSGNNTAQCIKVIGLGGSYAAGNAGAFSLGWPKTDWECSLDRAAKMAFSLGNYTAGWKLFCSQKTTVRAYRKLDKELTKTGAVEACLVDSKR